MSCCLVASAFNVSFFKENTISYFINFEVIEEWKFIQTSIDNIGCSCCHALLLILLKGLTFDNIFFL